MGIVSDEYTPEYCMAAHHVVDHEENESSAKKVRLESPAISYSNSVML